MQRKVLVESAAWAALEEYAAAHRLKPAQALEELVWGAAKPTRVAAPIWEAIKARAAREKLTLQDFLWRTVMMPLDGFQPGDIVLSRNGALRYTLTECFTAAGGVVLWKVVESPNALPHKVLCQGFRKVGWNGVERRSPAPK